MSPRAAVRMLGASVLVGSLPGCEGAAWSASGALQPTHAQLDTDEDGKVGAAEYARVAFSAPPFAEVDVNADGDLDLGELQALVFRTDPSAFFERPHVEVSASAASRHPAGGGKPGGGKPGGGKPGAFQPGGGKPGGGKPGAGPPPSQHGPNRPRGATASGPGNRGRGAGAPGGGEPAGPTGAARPDAYYVLLLLREEIVTAAPDVPVPARAELEQLGLKGSLTTPDAAAMLKRLEEASAAAHLDFPAGLRASGGQFTPDTPRPIRVRLLR